MLPAEAKIDPLSPSSDDGSLQPWKAIPDSSTQLSRRVDLPWQNQQSRYMQHVQAKYEKKITRLRDQLRAYVTSCNDSKMTEYEPFLVEIWRLFLHLKANNEDIRQNEQMYALVQANKEYITQNKQMYALVEEVVRLTEHHNIDAHTTRVLAAHYAFILCDKVTQYDITIPFDFLCYLLNEHGVANLYVHDVLAYFAHYDKTTDLSYNFNALREHEDNGKIYSIFKDVQMLQLYEYLYQFCSGKYRTVLELQTVWRNLMHAYDAYEKYNHTLSLPYFAAYFSGGSEEDIQKAGGKKVEEQTVTTILSNKDMLEAVEMINLPLLLSTRKSKIRRKNIGPYVLKAFPMQQKQKALNSVLAGLKPTGTHTQDAGRQMLQTQLYDTEIKLRNYMDILRQGNVEMQALDLLSKEVNTLLQHGVHPATSKAFTKSWEKIKKIFTSSGNESSTKPVEKPTQNMQVSTNLDSNETNENVTMHELLKLIYKFCTLEATSEAELNKLWHQIWQKNKQLYDLSASVGYFFVLQYGTSWWNSEQINAFCNANTFEEAVEWIRPKQLVGQANHESKPTSQDEDTENKDKRELLELIRQFCTLEQTSVIALENLWVQINEKMDENKNIWFEVGDFFVEEHGEFPVTSEEIRRFCVAKTFEIAVQRINLKRLVDKARLRPTKNQSTLLAEAYKCQLQLDALGLFRKHLAEQGVDAESESESYAVTEKTASTLEAEFDKALGKLREEQEVLPRLLEELEGGLGQLNADRQVLARRLQQLERLPEKHA